MPNEPFRKRDRLSNWSTRYLLAGLATLVVAASVYSCGDSVGPPGANATFTIVGRGEETARFTSDLWVHGNVAYTGTTNSRTDANGQVNVGNSLLTWDITDPANPVHVGTIRVDAQAVSDVKVSSDGRLAVITHERSSDGLNGVTMLNLNEPLHPAIISRFTESLERGVHNAWIDGRYVYLAVDGLSASSGLRVLDIADPANPVAVASFYAGSSFLHDVYVRDGLAFLSHWDAGMIILDVGNGIAGGAPTNPVEVGRVLIAGGAVHNTWYWPRRQLAFVGVEDFNAPGFMHVIDVSDLAQPHEIATFAVPGTTPHNFWLDEARAILYMAWYGNGLRALDVSGTLSGTLEDQNLEIVGLQYAEVGPCPERFSIVLETCTWAPQLHDGLIYVSDIHTGLWVLEPNF